MNTNTNIDIDKSNLININYKIRYTDPELYEKFNMNYATESEKKGFSDLMFKYDLVCIFGLEDFLEEIIIEKMNNLYAIMIQIAEIETICSNVCDSINVDNFVSGVFNKINRDKNFEYFMLLFSYDNLHLFYPCVCEFLDKGTISNEKIEALKNNILNNNNNNNDVIII